MLSALFAWIVGILTGKGTVQIGTGNQDVKASSAGANAPAIAVGGDIQLVMHNDFRVNHAGATSVISAGPLSTKAKMLLVQTVKDKNHNLVIWTPLTDGKMRMQAAEKRIYADTATHVEITAWCEAFEEVKPFYSERGEGNYFLKSEGLRRAADILSREPEFGFSDEAKAMLLEAGRATNGAIYVDSSGQHGFDLSVGNIRISDSKDDRQTARLKAAIEELRKAHAIEVYGTVGFKFTDAGYSMGERLGHIA